MIASKQDYHRMDARMAAERINGGQAGVHGGADFFGAPFSSTCGRPSNRIGNRNAKSEFVTRLCAPPRKSNRFLAGQQALHRWADFRSRYGRLAIFSWRGKSTGECGFESKKSGRRSNL